MATVSGTSGSDKLHGTSGGDMLQGFGGVDYMYGGAGNDAFVIRLSDFDASLNSANSFVGKSQDVIYDFGGAGGYNTTNNDFLSLTGFGAGSTMTFAAYGVHGSGVDQTSQFYTIHSTNTGLDYTILIHSTNGNLLTTTRGDYNFYG